MSCINYVFITHPNITGFSTEHPDMCNSNYFQLSLIACRQLYESQSFSHPFNLYLGRCIFQYEGCLLLLQALQIQKQACQSVLWNVPMFCCIEGGAWMLELGRRSPVSLMVVCVEGIVPECTVTYLTLYPASGQMATDTDGLLSLLQLTGWDQFWP